MDRARSKANSGKPRRSNNTKENTERSTPTSGDGTAASPNRERSSDRDSNNKTNSPAVSLNTFKNDGSFLEKFLSKTLDEPENNGKEEAPTEIKRKVENLEKTGDDTVAKPHNESKRRKGENVKESNDSLATSSKEEKNRSDESDSEREAREEFLRTLQQMEDAGLVTERGIGAGMVK